MANFPTVGYDQVDDPINDPVNQGRVTKLVPTLSDQDIVDDLRKRVIEAYKPLLALCTEANDHGLALQINIGPDAFGTFQIQQFQVIKVFK